MFTNDKTHLDYFRLLKESKRLPEPGTRPRLRVAVLSDASTQHLIPILAALFSRGGFDAELHAAEFDTLESEILDEGSALYRFAPDAIVLLPTANAIRTKFYEVAGDRSSFGVEAAARLVGLWDVVKKRSRATIIQATFVTPYEREFGSFGLRVSESLQANVIALNAALVDGARSRDHVLVCDVDGVASYVGKKTFTDERLWTMAKAYCALEHLPHVAQALVDVILAARGRVAKCVVLDLDNTLWGGVVGDDGVEGIQLGHFGEGEPFHRFQQYLRELKRRGVVLAVCSKNEHAAAIAPFRDHPEMVLREEDIAVFVANWETKVDNIKKIKETLNIGFDAMVFVDDNPFERNIVREYLPEVVVPELPEDPSDYVRALSELNLFETTSFTDEDRKRSTLYREEASRKVLGESFTNVEDYLRSLEMRIAFERFDAFHLPRIAQLVQRSNQFNLTTRRESLADCERLMTAGPDTLPIYVKLADRFGDYGLIGLVVARFTPGRLEVDTWLMSCRVLARGVEQYMMNRIVAAARERGVGVVVGDYIPTSKNAMVKDFYRQFGFEKSEEDPSGRATWTLDVERYQPRTTHFAEPSR